MLSLFLKFEYTMTEFLLLVYVLLVCTSDSEVKPVNFKSLGCRLGRN